MFHTKHTNVTVRRANASDAEALARLAGIDSGPVPQPPALVAEVDARILAALPLDGGRAVADPFEHTAELVQLLRLRAEQLRTGRSGEQRLGWRRPRTATA